MYSQIFLRSNFFNNSSLRKFDFKRYFSQEISSLKKKSTNVNREIKASPIYGASSFRFFSSGYGGCKRSTWQTCSEKTLQCAFPRRFSDSRSSQPNTNVVNNVFLFKYERPQFFAALNIFAPIQCVFWCAIGYFMFKQIKERDSDKQTLKEYFLTNMLAISTSVLGFFVGFASMFLLWGFTGRSVKYLILNKGGESATIMTYHVLSKRANFTVPLDHIDSSAARKEMTTYLPLKVLGHRMFYILDSGGKFPNPKLYDFTIGLRRAY